MKNLDLLIPQAPPEQDRWTWATVTQVDPELRIQIDGDDAPLDIEPECLFYSTAINQRVWVQMTGRRVIVHAPSKGVPPPVIPEPPAPAPTAPVGSVFMWIDNAAPTGYLLLNGGSFSSDTYPELAALVGDKYYPHSGTTYYLPNLTNRFPLGGTLGPGLLDKYSGSTTITAAQMPTHAHTIDHDHADATAASVAHTHGIPIYYQDLSGSTGNRKLVTNVGGGTGATGTFASGTTDSTSHSHSVDIPAYSGSSGNAGSGEAYWQPYARMQFIIKATP